MADSNYITGRPMPAKLISEMNRRGSAGRATSWHVSKKVWIELNSGSSKKYKIAGFEKRTVQDFYDNSDGGGRIVPKPIVNSVSISTTGTNGAMRKATVSFTAYSIDQLKKIQKAYFIPGLSCLVQWGWNIKSSDGSAVKRFPSRTFKSFFDGQKQINDWIEQQENCMDAMFGVISDFNWSFDPGSKSYSCEIVIDSPGKAYISGPVTVANKQGAGCKNKDNEEKGDGSGNWMRVALKDIAEKNMTENKPWKDGSVYLGGTLSMFEDGKEDASWWRRNIGKFFSRGTNHYVTWNWFESTIVSGMSPISPKHDAVKNLGSISDETPLKNWGKKHVWRLDSSKSILKIPKSKPYASSDPWVCLLPGFFHWDNGNAGDYESGWLSGLKNDEGITAAPKVSDGAPEGTMYLGRVLLNTYFLWQTYLDCKTIDEYVMKVAKSVNEVCGDFWNLELVDDPSDPSTMRVVDVNYVPSVNAPEIKIYGNTSARNWGMSTNIPQALRHSIMMATQKASSTGPKNTDEPQGSMLIYAKGVTDDMLQKQELDETPNAQEKCTKPDQPKKDAGAPASNPSKSYKAALANLADDRDDETVDEAKGALKNYANRNAPPPEQGGTVIPIGFEGEFDGIRGLTWGMLFKADQVGPVLEGVEYKLQTTQIKHAVSQKDWTTTIETALRI